MYVCNIEHTHRYLIKDYTSNMSPNVTNFIKNLKNSRLITNCPNCSKEFSLSKALLFDGTVQFPETAEITKTKGLIFQRVPEEFHLRKER